MTEDWAYQIRVYLTDAAADAVRDNADSPRLAPLRAALRRHDATLACQFDAFAAYVAEAEREGVDGYPLYKWTKATIDDPDKAAKHKCAFAVSIGGLQVYAKTVADALEADLAGLVDGETVTRISKQDTNPANNMPVPPAYR